MEPATIGADDFGNAGTSVISIQSVTQPLPHVVLVQVNPIIMGTLQLHVRQGAVLADLAGNPLNTTSALPDDTIITVNPAMVDVPFVVGMTQAEAETAITGAGLAVGAIATQHSASVPVGSVLAQNPAGGTSVSPGSPVGLTISLGPNTDKFFAVEDIAVSGTVTNSHVVTGSSDNTYQSLQEIESPSSGNPNQRRSLLEHKWRFDIPAASTASFHIEAHHTANDEGDNFRFAYSTTGANGTYIDMLDVAKTSDDNTSQSFSLPAGTSGTIHVRVVDTDRTIGRRTRDTLHIDQMYFQAVWMKTTPTIGSWPAAAAIIEGQPLSASVLTGGSASVPGSFTFDNPAHVPAPGNHAAAVTFTPEDTTTHDVVTGSVLVNVQTVFEAWATQGGGSGITFSGDANKDGLADGLAWLLGAASPAHDANNLRPAPHAQDGAFSISFHYLLPAKRGTSTLRLQHGPTLAADGWTSVEIPTASGTVGGVQFIVTPVTGSDYVHIQATIPTSPGSSHFLRLHGIHP
jgi:hypothetical protein